MALTQKQKAILNYLKDGEKKKSQIVNRFNGWYYGNSNKHIGYILGRMVESGKILRVKKGVYSLNLSMSYLKKKEDGDGVGQLSFF